MEKVAVVGCGVVGGSWAALFANAGYEVRIWDPSAAAVEGAVEAVKDAVGRSLASQRPGRVVGSRELPEALEGVSYVQESAPERLAIKNALYSDLAQHTDEATILASSTSGFPASDFAGHTSAARRCLVVHPINPPHLIPLVEIVPAPETDPSVVERATEIMWALGRSPIVLRREVNGFVANRLQSAVLAEAFKLVEDGVATVSDIDTAMKEGLAPRWFFIGPFETIDLNAEQGIADYCAKLGPMYHGLAVEQADPREWTDALITEVEAQRRLELGPDELESRRAWRDRCLAKLLAARQTVLGEEVGG